MKSLILLLSPLVFSSCMHVGMFGHGGMTGHDHSSGAQSTTTDPVLEKEVIVDDIKALASFPPLQMDKDVVLTLRLVEVGSARPISGARVYFHARYAHTIEAKSSHDHSASAHNGPPEREHEVNIDQQVKESSEQGVYSVSYGPSQPGEHTLMFHIAAIGDRTLDPELTIEATRLLAAPSHGHGSGMMHGTPAYIVIGAVAFGVVMTAMMLSHGEIF